jgi:hypothetical protein
VSKVRIFTAGLAAASVALIIGSGSPALAAPAGPARAAALLVPGGPEAAKGLPVPGSATILSGGNVITNNNGFDSPNGNTRLEMYAGELQVLINGRVAWYAPNVNGNGNYTSFQTDGNLVAYNSQSQPLWASNTSFGDCGAGFCELAIQNDGNVVIYDTIDSLHPVVWATNTGQ